MLFQTFLDPMEQTSEDKTCDNNNEDDVVEDKEELERLLQYKSIVLALHQCLIPALNGHDCLLFENVLHDCFQETNVSMLLQENMKNKETRSTSVKLELEDEDADQSEQKGVYFILQVYYFICLEKTFLYF